MDLKSICRICLTANVRMHSIVNTPLQETFEIITSFMLSTENRSVLLCYICQAQLKRCYSLQSRAREAERLMRDTLRRVELAETQNQPCKLTATNSFRISPTENISTVDVDPNFEVCVKSELKLKCEEEREQDCSDTESAHQLNTEYQQTSDSEDDVPLKNITVKKEVEKQRKIRKKPGTQKRGGKPSVSRTRAPKIPLVSSGFSADFATEIILSKEEQILELKERASSLNYLNCPLKCELCYKGFVDTRAYDNHMKKHDTKSGPYECPICHMRYLTVRHLRTHAANSHERRYACNRCPHRSHTANQARDHEKWHSGFTYECKLCGQTFRKPTSYLTHMRKRHASQHVCDICGDSFVGKHGLLMHKSKTHRDDKETERPVEPASQRYCSECEVQFASGDAWRRHILSSLKHKQLACDADTQCRLCQSKFPSSASLKIHLREHEKSLRVAQNTPRLGAKPQARLTCDQCSSHFVNRSKLQAHIKRMHLGLKYNKNIVCEVCGKKCTSNASLKYHQRTHTGEKPYQCDSCNKRFTDNNQLRIHVRTHTGERPYCCAMCGKRFSQKPALNRHYRVHTGAKPYVCQFCSKTFSQSNSLKLHVKTVHLKMPQNRKIKNSDLNVTGKAENSATENKQ